MEWTDKDTCNAIIEIMGIDINNPKSLYEAALIKEDLDQAYRLAYTHCEKYWTEAKIDGGRI